MGVMVGTGDGEWQLEAELAVVCGQLNQVSARLVAVTARAIESEGWAGAGIRSVEHWLVLRAGLSPGRARQVVLMARRAEVLPVVMGQFAAGRCRWTRSRWWPGMRLRRWRPRWPSWRSRRVCRSWGGCSRGMPSTRRPGTTPTPSWVAPTPTPTAAPTGSRGGAGGAGVG